MKLESLDIVSGDFRKISPQAPQTVNMNINITSALAQKGLLLLDFEYVVTYLPEGSHIRLLGKAILSGSESAGAAAEWETTGRISGQHGELIINAINYSASINAVLISKALNVAPPIVLPTLTLEAPKAGSASGKTPRKK